MQGSNHNSNFPDPTNPNFLNASAHGRPDFGRAGVAAIGNTGEQQQQQQSQNFPPLPQNVSQQLLLRAANNNGALQKARPGGLIGEIPVGGGPPRTDSHQGYRDSLSSNLRLGYRDSGNGLPMSQMPVYRSHSYAQQPGQVGSHNLDPRKSLPAIGSSTYSTAYGYKPPPEAPAGPSFGSGNHPPSNYPSAYGPKPGGEGPPGYPGPIGHSGGSIGGAPYQGGQGSTPMVGRMGSGPGPYPSGAAVSGVSGHAGSYISQQFSSPFVPASTSQPIIGGAASQYSMPRQPTGSGGMSYSTSGGMSQMGSISNLGSISQLGSIGVPSLQPSLNLSGNPTQSRSATSSLTTRVSPSSRVKAVCSSGGHFVKASGGGCEYQGGETRLIQVPNFCRFRDLLDALERITSSAAAISSASSEQVSPSLKYQLPTDENVYVDLMDDVDTQLMFDEWHEYSNAHNRKANAKLHLFVDWQRTASEDLGPGHPQKQVCLTPHGSAESILGGESSSQGRNNSAGLAGGSVGSARLGKVSLESSEKDSAESLDKHSGASLESPDSAAHPAGEEAFDYSQIAEEHRIHARELTVVKFVGSGGYGEVYLGKWHSSEAAIKCLNPSLFFNGGHVSQTAILELTKEAKLLGSLRHPNVVWFFGIVVPEVNSHSNGSDRSDGSDEAAQVATSAAQQQGGRGGVPAEVRPPAIVTEYMREGSLKGALQRKADIVQGSLMRLLIAMDAAKGMEYLHQKKIVHFDLKSANLLLGYRDKRAICKVADFGLSKQKHDTYVTNVTSQRGTLPWTAPEIIKNPKMVNEKVDVFSFGVVLWELWTGKDPYDGLNYHALLHQMTNCEVSMRPCLPGAPDWDPSVGPEPVAGYRSLMERCWSESPAGRPSFPQIVKCLKEMASSLRPRRPRGPASTGGRGLMKPRLSPREEQPSEAQLPAVVAPEASAFGREELPAASPFGGQPQPGTLPPAGPFGAFSQPSTPGGPFGGAALAGPFAALAGPFAALAGPFGGAAQSPPPVKSLPEVAVDRDDEALSIGNAVDVGSEGRIVLSPRTAVPTSEEDPEAPKDILPPQEGSPVSKPVVSAFGALASLPKSEQ